MKRKAYTLVEVLVVASLMAILAMLLAQMWRGAGRPILDMAANGRMALEANLAVASLQRDLGGALPGAAAGTQGLNRLVGRTQPGGTELWLCFDGGSSPNGMADWASPDRVVAYRVDQGRLVRHDQTDDSAVTVARHVTSLTTLDLGGSVRIVLAFSYRGTSRVYTLIGHDP